MLGSSGCLKIDSTLTVENNTTITGYRRNRGWAQNRITYFVLEFSKPFASFGLQSAANELPGAKTAQGPAIRAHLDFKTAANEKIQIRAGLSSTSLEGARFDLRRFHDELIGHGALPLATLERELPRWLAADPHD